LSAEQNFIENRSGFAGIDENEKGVVFLD